MALHLFIIIFVTPRVRKKKMENLKNNKSKRYSNDLTWEHKEKEAWKWGNMKRLNVSD